MPANPLLVSSFLLLTGSVLAQSATDQVRVGQLIAGGSTVQRTATRHLLATNKIDPSARVLYRAGQSVTLLPGFNAQAGAVFSARIDAIVLSSQTGTAETNGLMVSAWPNPVASTVTVDYTLPTATPVSRTLTDNQGRVLDQTTETNTEPAGHHRVILDMAAFPAGTYLLRLQTDTHRQLVRLLKF